MEPGFRMGAVARGLARLVCAMAATFALGWFHPASAVHAAIGTPVANVEMHTADGGKALALKDVDANVLVFFRPSQERSTSALRELARCQGGLTGKSVHWVAVVSGSAPVESATATLREAQLAGTLLVDRGDQLYGSLGLALYPVVVIVGRDGKLAAFEPFRSVDFCAIVDARIRWLLREITEEQLNAALAPPKSTQGGADQVARRYRALAEALLRGGKLDKASEAARKSIENDATAAPAHALLGKILTAQGNCAEAVGAFDKALAIDGAEASAKEGLTQCKSAR